MGSPGRVSVGVMISFPPVTYSVGSPSGVNGVSGVVIPASTEPVTSTDPSAPALDGMMLSVVSPGNYPLPDDLFGLPLEGYPLMPVSVVDEKSPSFSRFS